jgi:hypothetical protein
MPKSTSPGETRRVPRPAPVREPHVHLGVLGQAPLDGGWERVQAHAVHRGHAHRARHYVRPRAQALLEGAQALQQRLHLVVEETARLGGARADARRPLDEAPAVAPLQRAQLLAHRRLGDEVQPSRAREAARLHEVAEGLEGLHVHRFISLPNHPDECMRLMKALAYHWSVRVSRAPPRCRPGGSHARPR